jgi:hypothetical protein
MIKLFYQGYHVAKWNGTKVYVKILDKDTLSEPESMYWILFEVLPF